MTKLAILLALAACSNGGGTVVDATSTDTTSVDAPVGGNVTYLKGSQNKAFQSFGIGVAVSGDGRTMAVGAPGQAPTFGEFMTAGAVYVFARRGSSWIEEARLEASNKDIDDEFGVSVALSFDGSTLAIGARMEASSASGVGGDQLDNGTFQAGAVYVFTRTGSTWSQQAYVKASNPGPSDLFGSSVALSASGDVLVVGAPFEDSAATGIDGLDDDNATQSGAAYVFVRSGASWAQQAYVKASNTDVNDQFGTSVAVSGDGNTLAVGAYEEDSNATGIDGDQTDESASLAGAAYVFARAGTAWSQQAYVKPSNTTTNQYFGQSVALSADGNTLAVGAIGALANGAVYAFVRSGTSWAQHAFTTPSAVPNASVGFRVGIDAPGNTIIASASNECDVVTTDAGSTGSCGAAYVLGRQADSWMVLQRLAQPRPRTSDAFGESVAISGDGHTTLVSAKNEASAANMIDGNQDDTSAPNAGAAYVFELR